MKILVIGKNGLLGSTITKKLETDGHQCIALGSKELDISDQGAVEKIITEHTPQFVINTAAYTLVDDCEENEEKANAINGYGPGYIAQACEKIGATFIHFSTDYIFNGTNKEGYTEDSTPDPVSIYGSSKLLGEEEIKKHMKNYFILRISWLFGPTNEYTNAQRQQFLPSIIKWAENTSSLTIVDDQFGRETYAPDVADRMDFFFKSTEYGTYHLANEGTHSRADFAKEAFLLLNKPEIDIIPTPTAELQEKLKWKAKRPQHSSLINTKIPKLRDWKLALKDYLQKEYDI